jgi:hypothetical protein
MALYEHVQVSGKLAIKLPATLEMKGSENYFYFSALKRIAVAPGLIGK